MEVKMIPVDKIRPNPFQPRESFDKEKIRELADSIKGSKIVQPILVRKKGDTYQIIAGERRWRACQFAGLTEIPVIETEANDIETRELSLVENWQRLRLEPIEAENFIAKLYEDGKRAGRYKRVNDLAKKTGIPDPTLHELITANKERKELGLLTGEKITYTDLRETRLLQDQPELRKQVLKLRGKGKLTRDNLKEFSTVVKEASTPVRRALLKEDSKLTPAEAKVIDVELTESYEKERALRMLEDEKTPNRVKSLVHVVRMMEEEKEKEVEIVETDTGVIWTCPVCNKEFHLIHVEPKGLHRFEEVVK